MQEYFTNCGSFKFFDPIPRSRYRKPNILIRAGLGALKLYWRGGVGEMPEDNVINFYSHVAAVDAEQTAPSDQDRSPRAIKHRCYWYWVVDDELRYEQWCEMKESKLGQYGQGGEEPSTEGLEKEPVDIAQPAPICPDQMTSRGVKCDRDTTESSHDEDELTLEQLCGDTGKKLSLRER